MADSLCGPSNALQSFQKHSTTDRTLHQDRLVGRPSPSQGFRSPPDRNVGLLDPEFEVFQAGQQGFDTQHGYPQFSHPLTPLRPHTSHPSTPQHLQQASPSAWASDFQRLQISSPVLQPHFQSPVQQRQHTGVWHRDFAQNYQGAEQRSIMQSGQMRGKAHGNQYSPMSGGMGMGMGMGMGSGMQQYGGGMVGQVGQAQQQQPAEVFDDAAFARAFEEASWVAETENQGEATAAAFSKEEQERLEGGSRQGQDTSQTQSSEIGQTVLLSESAERFMSSDRPQIPNQALLGADLIVDYKLHPEPEDPDAMARTAAHLLDTVSNNTSDKFVNSEFFQLMRQFRDKELTVSGDKIIDRNGEATEKGGEVKVQA